MINNSFNIQLSIGTAVLKSSGTKQRFYDICKKGTLEEVREALANGADVNERVGTDRRGLKILFNNNYANKLFSIHKHNSMSIMI